MSATKVKKARVSKLPQSEVNITLATSAASIDAEDPSEIEPPHEECDYNRSEFLKLKWRFVCATLNNYSLDELANCKLTAEKTATYGIIGLEVSKKGTPHLQMYMEFGGSKRISEIRNLLSPRAAFFKRKGNPIQASSYCRGDYTTTKGKYKPKNEVVFEYGELTKQGERTDWRMAVDALTEGRSVVETIEIQPHLLPNIRALTQYQTLISKSSHRDLKVIVLYGVSGSGKTRWAYDNYPDLFSKPDGDWWDGYAGEQCVLLDDFAGGLPFHTLLKVADRYPLRLPIKGGFVPALFTTLVITSNKHPSFWYQAGIGAMRRRIHQMAHFSDLNMIIDFQPVETFFEDSQEKGSPRGVATHPAFKVA